MPRTDRPALSRGARAGLALAALGLLAACDPPLQELYPQERALLSIEGRDYVLRGQFDPFQRAYYTEVLPLHGPMDALAREEAIRLVEEGFGARLCGEGRRLRVADGVWGFVTDPQPVTEFESRGGWQIVARCA